MIHHEIKTFTDIEITGVQMSPPRGEQLVRGIRYGPIYPDYYTHTDILCPVTQRNRECMPASCPSSKERVIEEPLVWGGHVSAHYGHFLAETSSRIPQYKHRGINEKICFSTRKDQLIKPWFWEVLEWYGYSKEDVVLIPVGAIVKKLTCLPLNEYHLNRQFTQPEYLSMLDQIHPPVPEQDKQGTYYISRTEYKPGFCGEKYLEIFLEKQGVEIVYPEQLSVLEQLEIYRKAKSLIFMAGSSLFTLMLLGTLNCNVLYITRATHGPNGKSGFGRRRHLLHHRCKTVQMLDTPVTAVPGIHHKPRKDGTYLLRRLSHSSTIYLPDALHLGQSREMCKWVEGLCNWLGTHCDINVNVSSWNMGDFGVYISKDYLNYIHSIANRTR